MKKRSKPAKETALLIAHLLLDKKASGATVLEMTSLVHYTDYFVICSADNYIHAAALADHVEETLIKEHKIKPLGIEGKGHAHWILMDYGDVVVHIFEKETRGLYELEKLWLDAPEVAVEEDKAKAPVGRQDKRALAKAGD